MTITPGAVYITPLGRLAKAVPRVRGDCDTFDFVYLGRDGEQLEGFRITSANVKHLSLVSLMEEKVK